MVANRGTKDSGQIINQLWEPCWNLSHNFVRRSMFFELWHLFSLTELSDDNKIGKSYKVHNTQVK